jgi:hypothetical protein
MYDTNHQDDETSHVESMSLLSGEDNNKDDKEEEEEEEGESVMDYLDDTSSAVDAMSHTSGFGGILIPPVTVDETKTDDGSNAPITTTQAGEAMSEPQQQQQAAIN